MIHGAASGLPRTAMEGVQRGSSLHGTAVAAGVSPTSQAASSIALGAAVAALEKHTRPESREGYIKEVNSRHAQRMGMSAGGMSAGGMGTDAGERERECKVEGRAGQGYGTHRNDGASPGVALSPGSVPDSSGSVDLAATGQGRVGSVSKAAAPHGDHHGGVETGRATTPERKDDGKQPYGDIHYSSPSSSPVRDRAIIFASSPIAARRMGSTRDEGPDGSAGPGNNAGSSQRMSAGSPAPVAASRMGPFGIPLVPATMQTEALAPGSTGKERLVKSNRDTAELSKTAAKASPEAHERSKDVSSVGSGSGLSKSPSWKEAESYLQRR